MGRARGHSPQAAAATTVASGRFDAVVGARRGSVTAQATRDAGEMQAREDSLTEMLARIQRPTCMYSGVVLNLLAVAHRARVQQRSHTREYEKLCEDLEEARDRSNDSKGTRRDRQELIRVVAHGDPVHWPGLTYPATRTLSSFLQATNESEARALRSPSELTINAIINLAGKSQGDYQRLAPVFEGLATVLENLPPHRSGIICMGKMARVLQEAPTEMLAGPLEPLVQAFARRISTGRISKTARSILEEIVADQGGNGRVVNAFRPVADAL